MGPRRSVRGTRAEGLRALAALPTRLSCLFINRSIDLSILYLFLSHPRSLALTDHRTLALYSIACVPACAAWAVLRQGA
eukprot:21982-Rhodomonas_salina.1